MSDSQRPDNSLRRRRDDFERLVSWKAIANHLNRSVRTVRRWEAQEHLPVYRHLHKKGGSVYAFSGELDAWLKQRDNPRPSTTAAASQAVRPRYKPFAALAVAIIVVALGGVAISYRTPPSSDSAMPSRTDADSTWVLIASPADGGRIDAAGIDLATALRREISQISSHRVVPRNRVQETLRLMRKPAETELVAAVARVVALRDGDIRVLIVPRIERMGDKLVLSAEMIDSVSGVSVAHPSINVPDTASILRSLNKLATRLVRTLDDVAPLNTRDPLPRVTTASLRALELYAYGADLLSADREAAAEEALALATALDPEFAAAHALRARAARARGVASETYDAILEKALSAMAGISTEEQLFIEGTQHQFAGDLERADVLFRMLTDISHDHEFGLQALLQVCLASKPAHDCVQEQVRLAAARPASLRSNIRAAVAIATYEPDPARSQAFADRALSLVATEGADQFAPADVVRTLTFPLTEAWARGDPKTATEIRRELSGRLPGLPAAVQNELVVSLAGFSLVLGQLDEASALLPSIRDPGERFELAAQVLFAAGELEELSAHLASRDSYTHARMPLLMSIASMMLHQPPAPDDRLVARLSPARQSVIRAIKKMSGGDTETAKAILADAVAQLTPEDQGYYFVGSDLYSKLLLADGELTRAISVLEAATSSREKAALNDAGLFWLMCQMQLAHLYSEAGRAHDADLIRSDLRNLLRHADDGFPLAEKLKVG